MQRTKVTCQYCSKEISRSNINRHEESCKNKPKKISYALNHDGLNCQFCGKDCKNRNSLCNHERMCKLNPQGQLDVGFKKFNADRKAGLVDSWNKGLTKETSESVLKRSLTINERISLGQNYRFGGYREGSARNYKYGYYHGILCDSSWELAFLLYHLDNKSNIKRNTDYFEYIYNDKVHKYFPDFIIDNVYYEIKGRYFDPVEAKLSQFPKDKTLILIDKNKIQKYVSYAKNTYGKDFYKMYDRNKHSWLNKHERVAQRERN